MSAPQSAHYEAAHFPRLLTRHSGELFEDCEQQGSADGGRLRTWVYAVDEAAYVASQMY
jgi:hypothetical protein